MQWLFQEAPDGAILDELLQRTFTGERRTTVVPKIFELVVLRVVRPIGKCLHGGGRHPFTFDLEIAAYVEYCRYYENLSLEKAVFTRAIADFANPYLSETIDADERLQDVLNPTSPDFDTSGRYFAAARELHITGRNMIWLNYAKFA